MGPLTLLLPLPLPLPLLLQLPPQPNQPLLPLLLRLPLPPHLRIRRTQHRQILQLALEQDLRRRRRRNTLSRLSRLSRLHICLLGRLRRGRIFDVGVWLVYGDGVVILPCGYVFACWGGQREGGVSGAVGAAGHGTNGGCAVGWCWLEPGGEHVGEKGKCCGCGCLCTACRKVSCGGCLIVRDGLRVRGRRGANMWWRMCEIGAVTGRLRI
jgi:hypothetical protein